MLITDNLLMAYQRCDRRSFLDVYGDLNQLDPPSDFFVKLMQETRLYQKSIIEQQSYHKPHYPQGDWKAGSQATIELMKQGVDRIYRGVLLQEEKNESSIDSPPSIITLVSRPTLLIKQPGESKLGNWIYVPTDIRLGKRPKLDYQIIIAFHSYLLENYQEVITEHGVLFLRDKGFYGVNLDLRTPEMLEIVKELMELIVTKKEPEVFISRQKCNLCGWYSSCHKIAQSQKHLSLLPGVTPSRYQKLKLINHTTLETLAKTTPETLETYPEFGEGIAKQVIQQAQASLENRALLRESRKPLVDGGFDKEKDKNKSSLLPMITPIEIYFDIEAQPELNLDYLHGLLVVNNQNNTEKYYGLLAENSEEEEAIWERFLEIVWSYPIAPIYHFCEYETQTVKRLAKLYKTPIHLWRPLLNRFIDIHKEVTQTVTLPVESYALKPIARWMGFEWRDSKANGAQCVFWYDQWLATRDRTFLDAIVTYNEDDCRATQQVKNWLFHFLHNI